MNHSLPTPLLCMCNTGGAISTTGVLSGHVEGILMYCRRLKATDGDGMY